ncbi:MAG: DUF6543 domain-containing protein [Pseudomonas sp.]|uniref:dermonecrotic toxin domain-containing protein n=1 Tax=Pseudomonas sp. TaxID=306 RepID=UPI003C75A334
MPLLPTLMDAVAARIVNNKAVTYANRTVSFHRSLHVTPEAEPIAGLTADAFERFLNDLASNLPTRFKDCLDRYWNGPINATDSRTCKEWVAQKRLEIIKAEVSLLKADGVLEASSEVLLTQFTRFPDAHSRVALPGNRPCAYGLAIKDRLSTDIPLYGAFVLTSRDPDAAQVHAEGDRPPPQVRAVTSGTNVGHVLLFRPGTGFEAFDSLASLDRELHRQLNSPLEFPALLDLMEEKDRATGLAFHQQQVDSDRFRYVEKLESIFSYGIDSLYEQVQTQFTWMLAHYQRQGDGIDSTQLPASLDRVTDLPRVFDTNGLLTARVQKQARHQLKQFLNAANPQDKQAWETAVRDYSDHLLELHSPDGLPSLSQYSDPAVIRAYSNEQLTRVLEAEHGLSVNPDDIIVHTKSYVVPQQGAYVPGGKPHPSDPGARLFSSRERTLTDLALENVEWLDLNFVNFSRLTDAQQAPYSALSVAQVKDLVRSVNIGDSYEQFLKTRLVTSDEAKIEQQRYAQVMALQLRVDVLEAKIARDFLPDRLDRGYNWVMSVLAGPTDDDKRPAVEGHRIIVSSLKLRGVTVRGVLVFSAGASVASYVVYTPQAPSGRVFHEYTDASSLHRDFINHSAWREYLIERTELSARPRTRSVLNNGAGAAVIALTRIADNFLEEAYKVEASSVINDASAHSTSTQEANFESGITITTAALDIATMFLPVKVMLPIGLARSFLSVMDAVEAAQLGDRATAAHSVVRAFGELLGAVIDGAVGTGSARLKSSTRAASHRLDPKLSLSKKPKGVTPLGGWETHHIYVREVAEPGTFQAPQHFLLEQNRWYSIRRDNDAHVWRVRDPRRASSTYKGDPLYRNSQGVWEIRSPGYGAEGLALRGGAPTLVTAERALMDLFPYLDQQQAQRVFSSFVFPRGRERELQMSLVHQLITSIELPPEFSQYLLVNPRQFGLLIRGRQLPPTLVVSPVEPTAGTSRATSAVTPAAPRGISPPDEQRFLNWGQPLDLTTHAPIPERPMFWRNSTAHSATDAPEYIQMGTHHYATLPGGSAEGGAVIVPNNRRYSTFSEFEDMLHYQRYDQPRRVQYNTSLSRWLISLIPFECPIVRYIERSFPDFTHRSARQIAQALFTHTNPTGLNTQGYARLLNTLRDWRHWPGTTSMTSSDPLLLLSRHPVTPNQHFWSLNPSSHPSTLLELNAYRVPAYMSIEAFQQQNDVTTRTLMTTLLRSIGYEVFEVAARDHFLFRRRGIPTVYWMSLRRTPSSTLASRPYREPGPLRSSFQDLPAPLRAMALEAHSNGRFVSTIGVLQISRSTGVVTPFIFVP